MKKLYNLFIGCLDANYTHTEIGSSYAAKVDHDTLYLFFQWSYGITDWLFNFLFLKKKIEPYEEMGKKWVVHSGFSKVWDSIKHNIEGLICDERYKKIIIVGYSHGGAIATLCHEFVWFNRPDLRDSLEGYGFAAPRAVGRDTPLEIRERWANFYVIRNIGDIVTHLPPKFTGYTNVGQLLEIGERGRYGPIDAHRESSYINELQREEEK